MPRRNYKEGQWFLITVPEEYLEDAPDHRFGAGLVARGTRGDTVFSYIFGPWRSEPLPEDLSDLRPSDAVMALLMPDTFLRSGGFPFLTLDGGFSRESWPMPEFSMYMGGDEPAWAVRTSDDEPFVAIDKRPISSAEARAMPEWSSGAYGLVYRKLADPGSRPPRIADLYGKATRPQSSGSRLVQVDFVVPLAADALAITLSETLESRGWQPSTSMTRDEEREVLWVSATRPLPAQALDALDLEMEAIASKLPGVEYDGHGIHLSDA